MQNFIPIIQNTALFKDIGETDLPALLQCLGSVKKHFSRNAYIYMAGDSISQVGMVLNGRVQIIKEDIAGNRTIVNELGPTELFAESFACAQVDNLPVSVTTVLPSDILFINCRRIVTLCPSSCRFHTKLVENLLQIVAQKNIMLNQKIEVLGKRGMRAKLMAYLDIQVQMQSSREIKINFSRQELADYLGVDRSALSREISSLQAEGALHVKGKRFILPAD